MAVRQREWKQPDGTMAKGWGVDIRYVDANGKKQRIRKQADSSIPCFAPGIPDSDTYLCSHCRDCTDPTCDCLLRDDHPLLRDDLP